MRLFQNLGPIRGMQRLRSETCLVFKRLLEHVPCPNKVNTSVHPRDLTFQYVVLRALVDVGIHKSPSVVYM